MSSMDTVFFLTYPLAVAAGLVTITTSVYLVRAHSSRFFRAFLLQVMIFNLLILLGLLLGYAGMRMSDGSTLGWLERLPGWAWGLITIVKFLWLYSFVVMIRSLLGERITARFRILFACACAALLLVNSALIVGSGRLGISGRFWQSYNLAEIAVIGCAILSAIYLLLRSGRLSDFLAGAVRMFGAIYLAAFIFVTVVLSVGTLLYQGGTLRTMQLNALFLILYNLAPLFWIARYRRLIPLLEPEPHSSGPAGDTLANSYGITPREREVLDLACAGNTNQEIADALFISLQTVKDHVYSIYRKTGVRNRVELANLFRRARSDQETGTAGR